MSTKTKYYIIQIEPWQKGNNQALWYANKEGQRFKTKLSIAENENSTMVAVFKCIDAPFFHVYPQHCTIIKEETISIEKL